MSDYFRRYKLQEGMTMQPIEKRRVWEVCELSGLHVEDVNVPENANIQTTFVIKLAEDKIRLVIEYTVEGELDYFLVIVAEVASLEELKDKFPKLFELDGRLFFIDFFID